MPVALPPSQISQASLDALASLANTKLAGLPYKFLPPVFVAANEAGMLACWKADCRGVYPGGIVVRLDTDNAYRLTASPYTDGASWTLYADLLVYATVAAMNAAGGTAGKFAYVKENGWVYRRLASSWALYGGWRQELRRIRTAAAAVLFGGSFNLAGSGSQVKSKIDGVDYLDWMPTPVPAAYTAAKYAFSKTHPTAYPNGFPVGHFADAKYVYPGTGPCAIHVGGWFALVNAGPAVQPPAAAPYGEIQIRQFGMTTPLTGITFSIVGNVSHNDAVSTLVITDNLGLTTSSMERVGGTTRWTVTANAATWDGSDWNIRVELNPLNGDTFSFALPVPAVATSTSCQWVLTEADGAAGNHIHSSQALTEIPLPQGVDGRPARVYSRWTLSANYPGSSAPAFYSVYLWSGPLAVVASGGAGGWFWARPRPLANVTNDPSVICTVSYTNPLDPLQTISDTKGRSVLARFARETSATTMRQAHGMDDLKYPVSRMLQFAIPRVFVRSDYTTERTAKLEMANFPTTTVTQPPPPNKVLVPAGCTVCQVIVKRLPQVLQTVNVPKQIGDALRIEIGFIRSGAFVVLRTFTIPASYEAAITKQNWINFTQDSLYYRAYNTAHADAPETLDVQAFLAAPDPQMAFAIYNPAQPTSLPADLPSWVPVFDWFYNDTEAMLNLVP
jgi:hypothetical protein